jgi:hypothetical protein
MMTWNEFLIAMRGPGINAAVGVALYFILDWYPAFELLAPRMKRLAVAGLCLVIPLAATLLSVFTLGLSIWDWANVWWPAIVAAAAAFTSSTIVQSKDLPK